VKTLKIIKTLKRIIFTLFVLKKIKFSKKIIHIYKIIHNCVRTIFFTFLQTWFFSTGNNAKIISLIVLMFPVIIIFITLKNNFINKNRKIYMDMHGHISYIIIVYVYKYLYIFMYVYIFIHTYIHIYIYSCMKNFLPDILLIIIVSYFFIIFFSWY